MSSARSSSFSPFNFSFHLSRFSPSMGCGNSKLAPEGEVVPPRIRPLLRRRFLEMKKRRNGNVLKDGGLSKKNLLKDGEDEDGSHSSPPHSEIVDSKSTSSSSSSSSSSEKKEKLPEKPGSTEKAIKDLKEQDSKEAESTLVKKNVDITSSSKKEDKENVKRGEEDKPKIGEELKQKEATREKEEEDDEEDDDGAGEDDRFICPGSPSFRVYFLDAAENDKKKIAEEEDEDEEDDSPQKKTQSDDSFGSNESAASNNTAEERKRSKKGSRGRAFRRAIKKGGPVAVKNLLNVKSCYHPGCASGSGHDRASLLDGKPAAA